MIPRLLDAPEDTAPPRQDVFTRTGREQVPIVLEPFMQAADGCVQFLKMFEHVGSYDGVGLFDLCIVQIIDIGVDQPYVLQFVYVDNLFCFVSLDINTLSQIERIGQGRKENAAATAEVDSDPALWDRFHHAAMDRLEAGPEELADKTDRIEIQTRHSHADGRNLSKDVRGDLLKSRRRFCDHPS